MALLVFAGPAPRHAPHAIFLLRQGRDRYSQASARVYNVARGTPAIHIAGTALLALQPLHCWTQRVHQEFSSYNCARACQKAANWPVELDWQVPGSDSSTTCDSCTDLYQASRLLMIAAEKCSWRDEILATACGRDLHGSSMIG